MVPVLITIVTILPVIVLIGGAIWLSKHMDKKRTLAIESVAEEMGLSFLPKQDQDILHDVQGFELFDRGRNTKMKNVMTASTDATTMSLFDYSYVTGHGKNQRNHQQTVAYMQSDALKMPKFRMRPEKFFDKVGSVIGLQDIDFDDHPEFSQSFVLKSDEEESVRRFMDHKLLDFFAKRKKLHVEVSRDRFIYYERKRMKPEQLRSLMANAMELHSALAERLDRT